MTRDNIEWGDWVDGWYDPSQKNVIAEFVDGCVTRHRIGKPRAPVVTEQVLYWERGSNALCCQMPSDTHRITITMHDGEPADIKVEALK